MRCTKCKNVADTQKCKMHSTRQQMLSAICPPALHISYVCVVYYQACRSNLTDKDVQKFLDNSAESCIIGSPGLKNVFCSAVFLPSKPVWQSKVCKLALCLMHCLGTSVAIRCWIFSQCVSSSRWSLWAQCILILPEWNFEPLCCEPLTQNFHVLLKTCFYFWNRHPPPPHFFCSFIRVITTGIIYEKCYTVAHCWWVIANKSTQTQCPLFPEALTAMIYSVVSSLWNREILKSASLPLLRLHIG